MSRFHGADSEIGRLRSVIAHRPGAELRRVTPRDRGRLLFAGMPWADRARQEHDAFTQVLRDHDVQVLYLTELLQDALEYAPARRDAIEAALSSVMLGDDLTGQVRRHLDGLGPEALTTALICGLTVAEFRAGHGAVYQLLAPGDFIIEPLANLVFTRDSSAWIGDRVAVASLDTPGRRREAQLAAVIYGHHPLFAGTKMLYQPELEPLDAGDVLLAAPGVIAVGCHGHAAGVERLARQVFDAGLAHTVLAVAMDTDRSQGTAATRLDTICTMVDSGTVLMHPATAYSLTARAITPRGEGLRVSHPQAFLGAMADAIGLDRLHVIETGVADRGQWDDAGNLLALRPRVVVSHERNVTTNARLEDNGIEVIRVPASELCGGRGGPRSMCCPVARDPAIELLAAAS
ncbi:MAG TPA: arginine deiminase family protein [Streptosporangiaceae bacterium]|nr:arginine deiminase family protein [Streptosporangiaceae bacterium]